MTCEELIEFLMGYVDDELDAGREGSLRRAPRTVPGVRRLSASYRETVRLGKMICQGDDSLPADIPEDLVTAILDARRADG